MCCSAGYCAGHLAPAQGLRLPSSHQRCCRHHRPRQRQSPPPARRQACLQAPASYHRIRMALKGARRQGSFVWGGPKLGPMWAPPCKPPSQPRLLFCALSIRTTARNRPSQAPLSAAPWPYAPEALPAPPAQPPDWPCTRKRRPGAGRHAAAAPLGRRQAARRRRRRRCPALHLPPARPLPLRRALSLLARRRERVQRRPAAAPPQAGALGGGGGRPGRRRWRWRRARRGALALPRDELQHPGRLPGARARGGAVLLGAALCAGVGLALRPHPPVGAPAGGAAAARPTGCGAVPAAARAHASLQMHLLPPPPPLGAGRSCTTSRTWCACRRWTTSARWAPRLAGWDPCSGLRGWDPCIHGGLAQPMAQVPMPATACERNRTCATRLIRLPPSALLCAAAV